MLGLRLQGLEFRILCLENIHLTILRGFSWPSLAYNYVHKSGLKPDLFHFILVKAACLEKSEIACSNSTLAFKFERNKMLLLRSPTKIQYCGEPLCPRGSVLGLRPPRFEFRILCLEGSVISFISLSQEFLQAQFSLCVHKDGLKPHSFHLKPSGR